MAKVILCETMLKPSIVPMASESRADGTYYEVVGATLFNDPVCECPGFQFRGKCKHVAMIEGTRCTFHIVPTEEQLEEIMEQGLGGSVPDRCPICHNPMILYELNPELE